MKKLIKFKIFLPVILSFLFVELLSAQKENPDIHFQIKLIGYSTVNFSFIGGNVDTMFCFALILQNKSNHTIEFGHFTSSWDGYFQPVNKGIKYCGAVYNHNFPTSTKLKPNQMCINYAFFYKSDPIVNSLQLKFSYYEGKTYMAYQQHINNIQDHKPCPKPIYYLSNHCNIIAINRIKYFKHQEFNGPE